MECPALIKGYHTDGIDVKLSARKTRPKKPWDKRCCWKKYFLLDYPFKDKERKGHIGIFLCREGNISW